MLLHFYFPFKAFPENERERESTRAHERGEDPGAIASSSSSPRSRAPVRAPAPVRGAIAIAPSIAMSDRDHGAVVVDDFMYFLGCGLCFLICVFLLLFQTPNTRKYFSENFLKCNQTHGNIFHFRKLAFLENMYFPENVLQQPNTAYMKKSFNFCRKILIGSFSFFIILCSSIFRFETFDM